MNKNKNKSQTDISSILRDKMITTSLHNTLQQNNHFPPLSKLRGIDYLKNNVELLIYNPLLKKSEYTKIGQPAPMTLLIYGASGVGKTFLINSISQEYQIPIIIGNTESDKEIRETFRKGELTDKSIILFDNIDFLDEEEDQKVIKQLSECLNNYKGKSLVVGIIENISKLPKLLKRFDNELLIKIPGVIERKEICEFFAENVCHKIEDWSVIAQMTPGCTPRDLKKIFRISASLAVGRNKNFLEISDFTKSIREIKKQDTSVTFDNIGSLDDIKEELKMSIIYPSKFPDKFKKMGISKPSGVLLHGPPGCGKTLLAKAVSNMSHCNFISVRGPELISKFVGDSEKEIRDLFAKAKQLQPCVIFFDEIDSLCQKRNNNDFCNRIVNQILTLLDGLEDRGDVYLIGATNRLEILDNALLRPGRFDKIIEVPLPSEKGCIEIFEKCVKNIPMEKFDFSTLPLFGFSGAEISGITKESALLCLKSNFDNDDMIINRENVLQAIAKYKSSRNK